MAEPTGAPYSPRCLNKLPEDRASADRLLEALFDWQDAGEFANAVKELDAGAGPHLWAERRYKRLQEALSLSAFADALGMTKCHLCEKDPPDAEVCDKAGSVWRVEITIAMTPNRLINEEYRRRIRGLTPNALEQASDEDLRDAEENWRIWLLDAVRRKAPKAKTFDHLLIYNNISWLFDTDGWDQMGPQIGAIMTQKPVTSVWQHTSQFLDRLWPAPARFRIPRR